MPMTMTMIARTNFSWIESIRGRKFRYSEISEKSTFLPINADANDDDCSPSEISEKSTFLPINADSDDDESPH